MTLQPDVALAADELMVDDGSGGMEIGGRTPRQIAWQRIKKDKTTLFAIGLVILLVVLSIAAPLLEAAGILDPSGGNPQLLNPNLGSIPNGSFGGISGKHWLGVVPGSGNDLLSRVLVGLTFDMSIALAATVVTVVIGVAVGIVSAYFGRWVDGATGRIVDFILAFPQLLMLLALSPIFVGQPVKNTRVVIYLVLVLGFFGWPYFSRIIRSEVLSMREREFIEAARSLGASSNRIMWKEILPNLGAPILVYSTIVLPTYVSAEAALAYLGISLQPPFPTLGTVLSDSVNYAQADLTYFLVPGVMLVIVVLAFNLLGDGLRDALDPKAGRQ